MAAKKKDRKKKRTGKKPSLKGEFRKAILGIVALLLLVLLAGLLTRHFILRPGPHMGFPSRMEEGIERPPQEPASRKVSPRHPRKAPAYEVFPVEQDALPKLTPKPPRRPTDLPRIAIIIDDLGYQKKLADDFLNLDAVVTVALLPYSPFQEYIAESAHEKGLEVMLHLPMEPHEYPTVDPGPGVLLTAMNPDRLVEQLIQDLESIPHVIGVNNHMGSRMTENSDQMRQIFIALKKRKLYFVDSRTTAGTTSRPAAGLIQVPFGERDVFIDHIPEADYIRKQIEQLIRIAHARGQAIGIAHPHQITYDTLTEMLPILKKEAKLVPVSQVVGIVS